MDRKQARSLEIAFAIPYLAFSMLLGAFGAKAARVNQLQSGGSPDGLWLQGEGREHGRQPEIIAQRVIDQVALAVSIRVDHRIRGKWHLIGPPRAATGTGAGTPIRGKGRIGIVVRGEQDQAVTGPIGGHRPGRRVIVSELLNGLVVGVLEFDCFAAVAQRGAVCEKAGVIFGFIAQLPHLSPLTGRGSLKVRATKTPRRKIYGARTRSGPKHGMIRKKSPKTNYVFGD